MALTGVLPSLDWGVLNTFPGKSTNGLTPFISGVLNWRELANGENTPLSKSEIPQLSEFDASEVLVQAETGAVSEVANTAESVVVLGEGCELTVLVDVAVAVLGRVGVVPLAL